MLAMNAPNWWHFLIGVLLLPFTDKKQTITALIDGEWQQCKVSNPITFSELDEKFGEGNWKL
jgi:hypothetical protein